MPVIPAFSQRGWQMVFAADLLLEITAQLWRSRSSHWDSDSTYSYSTLRSGRPSWRTAGVSLLLSSQMQTTDTNHPPVTRKCKGQVAFTGTTHFNHHRLVISGEGQEDAGGLVLWVTVRRTPDTELHVPTLGGAELEKWQEGEGPNYETSSSPPRTGQPLPSRTGCNKKTFKKGNRGHLTNSKRSEHSSASVDF